MYIIYCMVGEVLKFLPRLLLSNLKITFTPIVLSLYSYVALYYRSDDIAHSDFRIIQITHLATKIYM